MSEKIVDALAKIKQLYIESVYNNDPRQKIVESQMNEVRKYNNLNENLDSKEQILNSIKMWKNSGTPNSDESSDNVEMVMRAINPPVNENVFYSWRDDINESILHELNDISDNKRVTEKKVDNYTGKKPVVMINPEMKTETVLIDAEELDEDFIEESIDIATDYLREQGMSVKDVDALIDELGVEEFSEWVMQLGYETLLEERAAKRAKPKKSVEEIKAEIDSRERAAAAKRAAAKKSTTTSKKITQPSVSKPSRPPGQERLLKGAKNVVQSATSPDNIRSTVKGALDIVARGALSAAKGHQRAMDIKKKGGTLAQQLGGGAGSAIGNFLKKGTSQFKEWVDNLLEEGYDLSEYTWDELYEEFQIISKKAELVEKVVEFVRESR